MKLPLLLRHWGEPWVGRWWEGEAGAGGALLSLATLPLAGLYRAAAGVRRAAYDRGLIPVHGAPIPVISVGNLVVGGTGKTPVTAWVARELQELGVRPAVLLRGYGQDEALLHRRWNPGALVLVGVDRVRTAREAARAGAEAAVLDDGFQHRRLARAADLVLLAAEHRFPGRLLPRGPYRESGLALARAHLVVVTRRTADDRSVALLLERIQEVTPGKAAAVLRLAPHAWTDVEGAPAPAPAGPLLAVTALAGPELFVQMVAKVTGSQVALLRFPDHHDFDEQDVLTVARAAVGRTVVVTEKDAVKLSSLRGLLPALRVLTLTVETESGADLLRSTLRRALGGVGSVPAAVVGSGERSGLGRDRVSSQRGRRP